MAGAVVTSAGGGGTRDPLDQRSRLTRAWRAKTDRLDTAMLMRVFVGWLRGERGHCSMVAVPTIDQEDAKRPGRERESLVGKRTRIINRMKAALAASASAALSRSCAARQHGSRP